MGEVAEYILAPAVINIGASFFLTQFLCRYKAKNFLAAKICFAVFFLGPLFGLVQAIQAGALYSYYSKSLFFVPGATAGYFYGRKKHS